MNLVNFKFHLIWFNEKMLEKKIKKFIYYSKLESLTNKNNK